MAQRKFKLKDQEASFCENMAARDDLHGKRAKTLLLLNDGMTLSAVGRQTGSSIGQVEYLKRIFKQKGLAIFPENDKETVELSEKNESESVVETGEEQKPAIETVKGKKIKKDKSKKKDEKNKKKKSGKNKGKSKKKSKRKKSKKLKGKKKK